MDGSAINARKFHFRLTSARIVLLSFLLMILLGAALLSPPFASRPVGRAPLETALSTAVSAGETLLIIGPRKDMTKFLKL